MAGIDLAKAIAGEAWTSEAAYNTLREMCDRFGHRFAGSAGEAAAADFMAGRFRDAGLADVHLERFGYLGWVRGRDHIEVVEPVATTVRGLALPYCPSGEWEAEVRSVGDGEVDAYATAGVAEGALRGRIVLCAAESSGRGGKPSSHRRDKYMRAVHAGATGFLYVNQNAGDLPVTGGLEGGGSHPAPIPGLSLGFETGAYLARLLDRATLRLRLRVDATFPQVESSNVVAELPADPASPHRHEVVLAGGHLDSHDIAPGALDNGAGVVVIAEAARILATVTRARGRGLTRTVRFVLFGAEEIGLLGSYEYVGKHRDALDHIRLMVNLDTTGRGAAGSESIIVSGIPALVPWFRDLSARHAYRLEVHDRFTSSSDHFPFAMAGVPSANLGTTETTAAAQGLVGRGWGHTVADTFDKANPKGLQSASMVAAWVLAAAAEATDWPVTRQSAHEIESQLRATGALDELVASGRWPSKR
jgi:Zn-dependent M28 family amino/carboxypeptidase